MKDKCKFLKEVVAKIFVNINMKNTEKGINLQYKYVSGPIEDEDKETGEKVKGWEFSIVVKELGYPDKTIQSFRFQRPNNIDRYSIEYNVFTLVLTTMTETSLITWNELGKSLNKDTEFRKESINKLHDDKETDSNTDKQ